MKVNEMDSFQAAATQVQSVTVVGIHRALQRLHLAGMLHCHLAPPLHCQKLIAALWLVGILQRFGEKVLGQLLDSRGPQ